jgi:hypothetical protein
VYPIQGYTMHDMMDTAMVGQGQAGAIRAYVASEEPSPRRLSSKPSTKLSLLSSPLLISPPPAMNALSTRCFGNDGAGNARRFCGRATFAICH